MSYLIHLSYFKKDKHKTSFLSFLSYFKKDDLNKVFHSFIHSTPCELHWQFESSYCDFFDRPGVSAFLLRQDDIPWLPPELWQLEPETPVPIELQFEGTADTCEVQITPAFDATTPEQFMKVCRTDELTFRECRHHVSCIQSISSNCFYFPAN